MRQTTGFEKGDGLVCKLTKAYGLKQAPRVWYQKLSTFLFSCGFVRSKSNVSLFIKIQQSMVLLVLVYVDDIIITRNFTIGVDDLVTQLNATFSVKDLERFNFFLGIKVSYSKIGIHLNQQ